MRLSSLKVAGFKSFADSTTLHFPQNRSAIVGPNGCGKSNVIDAIRWVMGESNARQLRGGSMQDVIFAGTSQRKPVGLASVELRFDNTYGKLGGAYNAYTELAIKRQVTREGKSEYFINGTRCRRKDITDIFLGTGLGPRSYAVIEQGMINRLVDAKPEEMRVFIEEAAGVSRYQMRRKETLTHLEHTQDNLSRLNDIALELQAQIKNLKKQAAQAEQYQQLKTEISKSQLQILSHQYHQHAKHVADYTVELKVLSEQYQAHHQDLQQVEIEEILLQKQLQQKLPQAELLQKTWQTAQQQHQETLWQLEQDQTQHVKLRHKIEHLIQQKNTVDQEQVELKETLSELESQMQRLEQDLAEHLTLKQNDEDQINHLNPIVEHQKKQVEEKKIGVDQTTQQFKQISYQLEQMLKNEQRVVQQLDQLNKQFQSLEQDDLQADLDELNLEIASLQLKQEDAVKQLNQANTAHQLESESLAQLEQQWQEKLLYQHNLKRDLAQTEKLLKDLQKGQSLDVKHPLLTRLTLTEQGQHYIQYIERLLGQWLMAETVVEKNDWSLDQTRCLRFEQAEGDKPVSTIKYPLISEWIEAPQHDIWRSICIAPNLNEAQQIIDDLPSYYSVLTEDGYWLAKTWFVNLNHQDKNSVSGQLFYHQHLTQLLNDQEQLDAILIPLKQNIDLQKTSLKTSMEQVNHLAQMVNQFKVQFDQKIQQQLKLSTKLNGLHQQSEQLKNQIQQLQNHLSEDEYERAQLHLDLASLQLKLDIIQPELHQLQSDFEAHQHQLQNMMQSVQNFNALYQQKQLELEQKRAKYALSLQDIRFKNDVLAQLDDQYVSCQQQQLRLETKLTMLIKTETDLKQKAQYEEKNWFDWKNQTEQLQQDQQKLSDARSLKQQKDHQLRDQLESIRLNWQQHKSQEANVLQKIAEEFKQQPLAFDVQFVLEKVELLLTQLEVKFAKLGAINLAAFEELQQLQARYDELSHQIEDLEQTIEQLQSAMKSIDQETKHLFMRVFNQINTELQDLFPKVFSGGEASLTLEDDWQSGVKLMARPPGKRNSSLALLSGGEKALTALALVFAIFRLNPAPFCVLDEVDAPLDDANVNRFCNLVKELSHQVQFIYITHNKLAMTMATDLLGVTMPEAGSSKLVSVSLAQAEAYTA